MEDPKTAIVSEDSYTNSITCMREMWTHQLFPLLELFVLLKVGLSGRAPHMRSVDMSKGKSSPTPMGMYGARILKSSSPSDMLVLSRCRDKKGAMLLSSPESPGLHNEGKLQSPGLWNKQKQTQSNSFSAASWKLTTYSIKFCK
jgi:hypothetical protein